MGKILSIVMKNLRLIVRARTSALIIFLGPLVLVTLLGLAFSQTSSFSLTAGAYSENYSGFADELLDKMATQEITVIKYDSLQDCITGLKLGDNQVCMNIPADLQSGNSKEVVFHVDYSQINLVWVILDSISSGVSAQADEISKSMTSDLLSKMEFTRQKIKNAQDILAGVEDNLSSSNSSLVAVTTDISGMNLDVSFSNIDVDSALTETANVASNLELVKAEAKNKAENIIGDLKLTKLDIEDAKDDSNDSSVRSQLDSIDSDVGGMISDLESLDSNINSDTGSAENSILIIQNTFNSLKLSLDNTAEQLTQASNARSGAVSQLETAKELVQRSMNNIVTVNTLVNEVMEKLASISVDDADSIVTPIQTKIQPLTTEKTHFANMFPSLVVLVIMITGVLLASNIIVVEKKSKAFYRNHITPTSFMIFNISTQLTALLIVLLQVILFVTVSAIFFEAEVLQSIGLVLVLVLISSVLFVNLGMLIGFLFRTMATSTLAAVTVSTAMMLLSDVVIPLEGLPRLAKKIVLYNPFVVAETAMRRAAIFHLSFGSMTVTLAILTGYAVLFFAIIVTFQIVFNKLALVHFDSHYLGYGKKAEVSLAKRLFKKKDNKEENKDDKKDVKKLDDKNEFKLGDKREIKNSDDEGAVKKPDTKKEFKKLDDVKDEKDRIIEMKNCNDKKDSSKKSKNKVDKKESSEDKVKPEKKKGEGLFGKVFSKHMKENIKEPSIELKKPIKPDLKKPEFDEFFEV